MGWDVKATAIAVADIVPPIEALQSYVSNPQQIVSWIAATLAIAGLFWLARSAFGRRVGRAVEETMFANWQLALLGSTGIILSLASGWTTWDGMRNFTGDPILSLMVTFGIQGVMLIVAWLIGESFAVGMNHRPQRRGAREGAGEVATFLHRLQPLVAAIVGILLFVALMLLAMQWLGSVDIKDPALYNKGMWALSDKLLFAAAAILVVAIIAINSGSDLVEPYTQSARVIVKNSVLWVMFLACMATSVFFSFDSLFTAIFPKDERVRAAELRAQNQVAGIISDIGSTVTARRVSEADRLFDSPGWRSFDGTLAQLAKAAQGSSEEIERYFNERIEERNRAIKQQQERIASAQGGQAGLTARKISLTEELSRLKGERPALVAEYAAKKGDLDSRAKEIDAKRVDAMAEDRGVEGSLKSGKGPIYRQRVDELAKLQDYYKIGEERVKDAQRRLAAVDTRISQIERELAVVDGDLAKFKGESETAEQRIRMTQEAQPADAGARVDPARVVPAFESARLDFRQNPDAPRLAKVQQLCGQLYHAMATATPETKRKVSGVDCDPKQASEAAAVVFALNSGLESYAAQCAGGDKLAQHKSADALFGFARKCLADSGLPSRDTDTLRTKINYIELSRDDKAHRFVVTWNAFQDGNRLAYLALAIAVAIDGLVFMSGLFGANAVRSPLSDVPSYKARSASQLEAVIDTALLPHTFDTARTVLGAMRPMTQREGWIARVIIDGRDPHAGEISRVLSAGATIGAVRQSADDRDVYEIRAELFEYLSGVTKREFKANKEHASLADLERTISVALLPDVANNIDTVLSHLHPIKLDKGFCAQLDLSEIPPADLRMVRNALNAGATLERVQHTGETHYYIHTDFYKTLLRLRARLMSTAAQVPMLDGPHRGPRDGGDLTRVVDRVGEDQRKRIEAPVPVVRRSDAVRRDVTPAAPKEAEGAGRLRPPAEAQALFNNFLTRLLIAAELDPAAFKLISSDDVHEAALDAGKALDSMQPSLGNATRLGAEVAKAERIIQQQLSRAHEAFTLPYRASGDAEAEALLQRAHDELSRCVPALMLAPNGPLEQIVGQMIAGLEHAATPDDGHRPEDHRLLKRLRDLQVRLVHLDRASPESWDTVGQLVFQYEESHNEARFPRVSANH